VAYIRQSRPDSSIGFQVKVVEGYDCFCCVDTLRRYLLSPFPSPPREDTEGSGSPGQWMMLQTCCEPQDSGFECILRWSTLPLPTLRGHRGLWLTRSHALTTVEQMWHNTKHQNIKYQTPNTRTSNTKHQTPNTKHQTSNTETGTETEGVAAVAVSPVPHPSIITTPSSPDSNPQSLTCTPPSTINPKF